MAAARDQDTQQQGIQSIEIGWQVLLALEEGRGPMALSEIAKSCGMHPAKVHRYLVSLLRTGLASQDATTGLYDLGPAARHLGIEALRRTDSVSTASAYAVELRDTTGHSVNVAVWNDTGPTIVRWDTGAHDLPIVVRVGSTLPLLDSAVGYIFVAYLPASVTTEVMKRQQRQSETRQVSLTELRALKASVRRDGFAGTKNQMIFGLAALAAPVFGANGELELVLGVVLPARMMTPPQAKKLAPTLVAAAERTSRELGFNMA